MANYETRKYTPSRVTQEASLLLRDVGVVRLDNNGLPRDHLVTNDFPPSDPWSRHTREVIKGIAAEGRFQNHVVTELGIGDGRNILYAGGGLAGVVGVDIDSWRLDLASYNLRDIAQTTPVEFWEGDAVGLLDQWGRSGERIPGWIIACLPQSPQAESTADGYDADSDALAAYREWNVFGLSLNAAVLDKLRQVTYPASRTLIVLSDRIPPHIKEQLFERTGWDVENVYQTRTPIQQDPDTGIEYVAAYDDGERFYERREDGFFTPISATEAEKRRIGSMDSGAERAELNVYHHVSLYELSPIVE